MEREEYHERWVAVIALSISIISTRSTNKLQFFAVIRVFLSIFAAVFIGFSK